MLRFFRSLTKYRRARLATMLLVTLVVLASRSSSISSVAYAQAPQSVQQVVITLHKSVTLPVSTRFTSAVVGAPEIVDAMPMTDRVLYIQAKHVGTTNISIYDENMRLIKVVDVEVAPDIGSLQSKIRASTGNNGIRVTNDGGQVILSGAVSDALAADKAYGLAKAWVGGIASGAGVEVVNAMTVASPQQVMLKVRFLEVDRNAQRAVGINWSAINGQGNGVTTGQGGLIGTPPPATGNLFATAGTFAGAITGGPFGTILAQIVNKGVQIDTLVTALETRGLLQRLAEPNLVALSGDTASFLVGGQIPVPTISSTSGGAVTPNITYEPFGVLLKFRPTVLANGVINLAITPEVSELDFTNAVTISGTTVPAFTTRTATTTIALRDGQSFAIAGLLQADSLRNISQIPWLGTVPILGTLFRSASYQKTQTDLVIIVTPSLAQPAAPGARLATPFDKTTPSNDVDFFLNGQLEERKQFTDYLTTGGGIQGPYGHMLGIMQGPDTSNVQK